MKKPIIIAIILFVLAIGSCTAFFIVKSDQDKKNEKQIQQQNSLKLFEFDPESITGIEIKSGENEYSLKYDAASESWKAEGRENFPVSHDYCTGLLTFMSSLTADKDLGEADDAALSSYGLDNGNFIKLSDGVNTYSLKIGNITPTNDNYYIMPDNRKNVYLVDALDGVLLVPYDEMLRNPAMIGYSSSDISRIKLVRDGKTAFDLTKGDLEMWDHTDKSGLAGRLSVDTTAVSPMITLITRLQAESFATLSLENKSDFGFDKPVAELYVYNTDGDETHLMFSYYGEDAETYTHVLDTETGVVGLYYTYDVDFIEKTIADYLYKTISMEDIYNVSALDIKYNGEDISFKIDADASQYEVNGMDIDIAGTDACDYFNNMFNAISYLEFSEIDENAADAFEKQADESAYDISIKYTYADGTQRTMGFVKFDENRYYVMIDSEYTGLIVREKDISGTSAFMYWYDMLIAYLNEKNA